MLEEMSNGKRLNINKRELSNATKLERSLYPKNVLIPKQGDVFETTAEVEVTYLTHHFAPYTGGEKAILPEGVQVICSKPNSDKPLSISAKAKDYNKVEKLLIPEEDRNEPTYDSYSLSIDTKLFEKSFKMIELKPINYVKGDATQPIGDGNKVIVHVCNDVGGWGKGFVTAISKRWKEPENKYRIWFKSKENFELGEVQFVSVKDNLWVANMIGQRDIKPSTDGIPPIREVYISRCLEKVKDFAIENDCSVHMPRIGCGLAGGKWENIEPRIKNELIAYKIETTVYDFE